LLRCQKSKEEGKYTFLDKLNLEDLEVQSVVSFQPTNNMTTQKQKLIDNSFSITHPLPLTFILSADTMDDKVSWINELQNHILICKKTKQFYLEEKQKVAKERAELCKAIIGTTYAKTTTGSYRQALKEAREKNKQTSLRGYKNNTYYKMSIQEKLENKRIAEEELKKIKIEKEKTKQKVEIEQKLKRQVNRSMLDERVKSLNRGSMSEEQGNSYKDKIKE